MNASRQRALSLGLGPILEANRSQTSPVAVIDPASGTTVRTFRASTDESAYTAAIRKAQSLIRP